MSVRLDPDTAWRVVSDSHTGILTTLRRDGWPISLPVWFAVLDQAVYVTTPAASKKVARVRRDGRGCFLVESGLSWRELRAVVMPVRASIEQDPTRIAAALSEIGAKYAAHRSEPADMPPATREHYAQKTAVLRLEPTGRFLSWDNSRLFAHEVSA